MKQTPAAPAVSLAVLVDALGDLKAHIAPLTKREEEMKRALIAAGVTPAEGERFRATVSASQSETLDLDRTRALLDTLVADGVISRQKRAALNKRTSKTTVRVVAKVRS